jgi:hypothetical protein
MDRHEQAGISSLISDFCPSKGKPYPKAKNHKNSTAQPTFRHCQPPLNRRKLDTENLFDSPNTENLPQGKS